MLGPAGSAAWTGVPVSLTPPASFAQGTMWFESTAKVLEILSQSAKESYDAPVSGAQMQIQPCSFARWVSEEQVL